jgi:hypothetical protein
MKLVFIRKTAPHPDCVWVDWDPEDKDVSWVSLFHEPTIEEQGVGWRRDLNVLHDLFQGFLRVCVPHGAHAYGVLISSFEPEYHRWIDEVKASGLTMITREEVRRRRRD